MSVCLCVYVYIYIYTYIPVHAHKHIYYRLQAKAVLWSPVTQWGGALSFHQETRCLQEYGAKWERSIYLVFSMHSFSHVTNKYLILHWENI